MMSQVGKTRTPMGRDMDRFAEPMLTAQLIDRAIEQAGEQQQKSEKLWDYYANPGKPAGFGAAGQTIRLAQEQGLPVRITGSSEVARKEVVIENDIGWRVDAGVDLLFGAMPTIQSRADNPQLAEQIEVAIAAAIDANGGLAFFQKLGVVGSVFGSADVILRPASGSQQVPGSAHTAHTTSTLHPSRDGSRPDQSAAVLPPFAADELQARAAQLRFELVHPQAAVPVFDPQNPHQLLAFVQRYRLPMPGGGSQEFVEILGRFWWQRWVDGDLVAEGANGLARLPLVHIQNLPEPFGWYGRSDVEPLVALQDELNTRLSDRANRVTLTSFRMYLGKRIPDFVTRKVGPGQMWSTEDTSASIESFGGDADCPSERDHILQIREALDKSSGINPLAAGVVRDRVGNLTSGVALRVTLLGAVARTTRKREVYGRGLAELVELELAYLDHLGVLPTRPQDRRVELHWPPVLPDELERELAAAREKIALGVPQRDVIKELGYEPPAS